MTALSQLDCSLRTLRGPGAFLHPAAVRRFSFCQQVHVLLPGESRGESQRDIQGEIVTRSAERRAGRSLCTGYSTPTLRNPE